jgi:hypothetical protein
MLSAFDMNKAEGHLHSKHQIAIALLHISRMLIKIIKLFGALTPLEPRLGKKLIEPLTNLIHSTSAMSLLYECINTVSEK